MQKKLNKKDAKIIRKFRQAGTWRRVATLAAIEWPERNYLAGNQIEGMDLCYAASKTLGQNPDKEPWN